MTSRNNGPAPELHHARNTEDDREPAAELLVQYPRSEPIAVTLLSRPSWSPRGATDGKAAHQAAPLPELSSSLSWAAVAGGVLLAGALWSAILF